MAYPNMLAAGVTFDTAFAPFELWAGESDLVTSQGTAGTNLQQFQVVERSTDGTIIPWSGHVGAGGTVILTFTAAPAVNDTFTINGTVITVRASGATGNDINLPGSAAAAATAIAAVINAADDVFGVSASATGAAVTLTSVEDGAAGVVAVSETSANASFNTSTTAGQVGAKKALGFMAQAAVIGGPAVYFTGGVPNHAALIWPAGVTTLNQRKAAFDGTNITVSSLL